MYIARDGSVSLSRKLPANCNGKESSMPIYVQYGSIPGEVADTGQLKWIEINSFQFGVGRGVSSPTGGKASRESSTPSVGEIVVKKPTLYSLANVNIINALGPPQPRSGRQPAPNRHRAAAPVPPWLKNILAGLRPYMKPTGTIHLGGFQFDARELSMLAGVPVRELR
jgi:hypothetical protein